MSGARAETGRGQEVRSRREEERDGYLSGLSGGVTDTG